MRPSGYARRMKRLMGVLLVAVAGSCSLAQTMLVPATALEFALDIPLPPDSYRAFLPFCDGNEDAPSPSDRCYYLGASLADSLTLTSGWFRVNGYTLALEEPSSDGSVTQAWRRDRADGAPETRLRLLYTHVNGEVLLIVKVF